MSADELGPVAPTLLESVLLSRMEEVSLLRGVSGWPSADSPSQAKSPAVVFRSRPPLSRTFLLDWQEERATWLEAEISAEQLSRILGTLSSVYPIRAGIAMGLLCEAAQQSSPPSGGHVIGEPILGSLVATVADAIATSWRVDGALWAAVELGRSLSPPLSSRPALVCRLARLVPALYGPGPDNKCASLGPPELKMLERLIFDDRAMRGPDLTKVEPSALAARWREMEGAVDMAEHSTGDATQARWCVSLRAGRRAIPVLWFRRRGDAALCRATAWYANPRTIAGIVRDVLTRRVPVPR